MQKKMRVADDTTLIITTYNKPVFLELVLKSVMRQRVLPCEVIVADDGSKEDTKALIERYQALFPVPLVHSWIPDEGFRLSMSRNVAIAKAKGDYIIIIDGDIVLGPSFVADHVWAREEGCFVNGNRARLTKAATQWHCKTLNPRITTEAPAGDGTHALAAPSGQGRYGHQQNQRLQHGFLEERSCGGEWF